MYFSSDNKLKVIVFASKICRINFIILSPIWPIINIVQIPWRWQNRSIAIACHLNKDEPPKVIHNASNIYSNILILTIWITVYTVRHAYLSQLVFPSISKILPNLNYGNVPVKTYTIIKHFLPNYVIIISFIQFFWYISNDWALILLSITILV